MNDVAKLDSSGVIIFVIAGIVVIGLLFGFIMYFLSTYRHKQKDYLLLEKHNSITVKI